MSVPVLLTGTLAGEKDILAPAGSHSATITVICGGEAQFTLSGPVAEDSGGVGGSCNGGSHSYRVAVKPLRELHVQLELTTSGRFVVETRFSSERWSVDAELAAQCAAMVKAGSDVFDAEDGFTRGTLSLAEWRQRLSDASGVLQSLDSQKLNALSDSLAAIAQAINRPGIAPGAFAGTAAAGYNAAVNVVSQACAENGTPSYVSADYGG